MNKVFGIDMDTWTALNAIGAILSAFGTLAAVIIALRLARRDRDPLLDVRNTVMKTVHPAGDQLELVLITGTNLGQVPITVKGCFWSMGWWRWKQDFITVDVYQSPWSTDLPSEITHSQQVTIAKPVQNFVSVAESIAGYLRERWYRRFLIRSLRCGLYTSNGDFSGPSDERVRSMIKAALNKKPAEDPASEV